MRNALVVLLSLVVFAAYAYLIVKPISLHADMELEENCRKMGGTDCNWQSLRGCGIGDACLDWKASLALIVGGIVSMIILTNWLPPNSTERQE